jgi:hypothetical protein
MDESSESPAWNTGAPTSADRSVDLAWLSLPPDHRSLLEEVGAARWQVVNGPLGSIADQMLTSAGLLGLTPSTRASLERALGTWIPALGTLLINATHPSLTRLDSVAYKTFVAHIAWHEWGHALSLARCSHEDVAAGGRLLERAPAGIRENIRSAGYRSKDYTHEIVAETYALMMARLVRGHRDKPIWLHDEIYNLLTRATGWNG